MAVVPDVTRLGGADRFGTAALAATRALEHGAVTDLVWVATGATAADALAVGAAARRAPLLLVDAAATAAATWLGAHSVGVVRAAGGPDAISAATLDALAAVLQAPPP